MRPSIVLSALIPLTLVAWTLSSTPSAGELLYRKGILPSAKPLFGERKSGGSAEGASAACVNCHRPSGLGSNEGGIIVPPITSRYLFHAGDRSMSAMGAAHPGAQLPSRSAYTDVTLARAIREGIGPNGRTLNYLMPRYPLDDATMASLISYLKGLSTGPVPGVSGDTLHFATVITPDADPVRRKGMLDVLEHYFATKNQYYRGKAPALQSALRIEYRVLNKWQLHVWELTGPPETWEAQLHERLKAEPVFALISGLGGKTWEPIHRFCEQESIPCLLPNVDLPVVAEDDFYDIYFSKGVLLEAQLIARQLQQQSKRPALRRVVQVFRADDIGAEAAKALRAAAPGGIQIKDRVLKAEASGQELHSALKDAGTGTALVLWLRPEDLGALPPDAVPGQEVYLSGLMGGLENAPLPENWRSAAFMTYPFELPSRRGARMDYPLGWFNIQHIPVVAERTQTDTYIACSIVADTLGLVLDNYVRDYLIERLEVMLSSRIVNGYYTRLGLAPGQRFASKGGYIVRFAEPTGKKILAQSDWIVP